MASGQHYSLRWNNHESHVLKAFDSLLQNEALVDCTLVCEDTSIRAHKVVLSACSPYFQKIFTDNPCKHPIIVLKDVQGWEVQCIVDFMYKGETSVPEDQLTSLIKAAEGLKVRGLIRSDQTGLTSSAHSRHSSRHNSPMPNPAGTPAPGTGYSGRSVHYSPSPARYPPSNSDEPHAKVPHIDQSSPMALTAHDPDARRTAVDRCSDASSASARGSSPGPPGSGPRRKQARPRRRSGDSIGNASLDLSKGDSPPFRKSPSHLDDAAPENLSMKRPHSSSPAINLVKTETLMEDGRQGMSDNISDTSSTVDREHARALAAAAAAAAVSTSADDGHSKSTTPSNSDHFLSAFHSNGLQQHEHEARVEALQALNYMARGMGLPPLPHGPHGHPLAGHPQGLNGAPHLTPHHVLTNNAGGVIGRPTSTPSTGTSAFNGHTSPQSTGPHNVNEKTGFEFQRISIDRTKMSEEEAFEHAIEMIQTRQMGFRKAADFFSVSKWKLYKTARKRGIYAEIKKQNQAQQALTKVPTNVQHFADLGVYKQLKKKTHLTKDGLFPHLPGHPEADTRKDLKPGPPDFKSNVATPIELLGNGRLQQKIKVFKAPTNNNNNLNNNNNNNNNLTSLVNLQKKMLQEAKITEERNSNGENDPEHLSEEEREAMGKPETMIIRPALPSKEAHNDEDDDVDIDEEEDERVLVINHETFKNETASPEEDEDSGREHSA